MRLILSLLLAASVFAQPLTPQSGWCCVEYYPPGYSLGLAGAEIDIDVLPVDPITDRMRYEIAAAQRDYLIAKQQYEQATAQLRSKMEQADKACGGKFDPQSFACAEKK